MLLVQKYLETKTFGDLKRDYGVNISFSKSGHKFSLNYDQLESKEDNLLSQQCRGLILAAVDGHSFNDQAIEVNGRLNYDHLCPGETTVLCYGMDRFFNLGQRAAANIDWNDPNLACLEKIDGTLCLNYFDKFINQWCVATRSVPEADVELDGGLFTFRTLFEKALKETNGMTFNEFTDKLDKEITYCFELTSPYNRVVVSYKETKITFIAARLVMYICSLAYPSGNPIGSFHEFNISDVPTYGIPHVHAYTFKSVNDVLEWVSAQNPIEHEGIVALQMTSNGFKRVKVKNPAYVALNRARDILGSSERNCLELVLLGKEDDVISTLPQEIADRIIRIKRGVSTMIKEYDRTYKLFKYSADQTNKGDRKTFALIVKQFNDVWASPMFDLFSGNVVDMKDFLMKNKKELTWSNSFLDKILSIIKNY